MDEADVNELLIGYRNYQLDDVWEEPDEKNGNTWIWKIDEHTLIACFTKINGLSREIDHLRNDYFPLDIYIKR